MVCLLSMNLIYAQQAAPVTANPPVPAQPTADKASKQGDTKQAPATKKPSTRIKTKTATTAAPVPANTASDKAPQSAPASTGAGDTKSKEDAGTAPKTRMAISEQGIPADKPKSTTTSPTSSPK